MNTVENTRRQYRLRPYHHPVRGRVGASRLRTSLAVELSCLCLRQLFTLWRSKILACAAKSLKVWWSQAESNRRPLECHSTARIGCARLPNLLRPKSGRPAFASTPGQWQSRLDPGLPRS